MLNDTIDAANAPADYPGWRLLGLGLILRAVLDARKGDPAARAWLIGADGHAWAELLDLPAWPPAIEPLQPHKASQ